MGIVSAVVGIVAAVGTAAAAVGAVGAGTGAVATGVGLTAAVYGGKALLRSVATPRGKDSTSFSPTYQFGVLRTQTDNQLPVGLIYGENKLAGNRLWQQLRENNTVIERIVAFGEGEIESIEEVKLNDMTASEVGATVRTYLGSATQAVDDIVPGDTQSDKIGVVGSLKHLAYAAISLKANENIRSDYNLTAVVKGRKVRVYSDTDTYEVEYSNNPAWCLLDYLIAYNACGIGLKEDGTHDNALIEEFIDIDSFIEAAAYCDESVNGKPRFTFNMIIDSKATRRDTIEEFKKACRGVLVIKGKRLQLKIDKGSSPIKTIERADIIAGSEKFWTTPREENYDRIIVKYRSMSHDWAIVEAIAERETFENVPPVEHTVNIYAVSEHQQASLLAWYYLNKVKLERQFGYFETDYRAFDLEIGDVINLNENLMNFINKQVKITKVSDNNDGTFGVFWREYNPDLYTDTMGSLEPTVTLTDLDNVYLNPPCPQGFSVAQALDTVQMSWDDAGPVGVTYEIREGESWERSKLVAVRVSGQTASLKIYSVGLKKYFIKSKSAYGIYSSESASDTLYVSSVPFTNLVFYQSLISDNGEIQGGNLYQNAVKPSVTDLWVYDSGDLWQSEGVRSYASGGYWGAPSASNADVVYTSAVYDIGGISQAIVSLNYDFYSMDNTAKMTVQWAYSSDNASWSDWLNFCEGMGEFRYFKFKFTVQNPSGKQFLLSNAVVSVDVADRDEYYCDVAIVNAGDGVVIDFANHPQSKVAQPFITLPAVVANISDSTRAYCVVTQKSLQSATIKAYDYQGNLISASVDVRVKGF